MRVVLTGASSFTGTWFALELNRAGQAVTAPLRGRVDSYQGIRGHRVAKLRQSGVTLVENCSFGDPTFLTLMEAGCDVLCHHAANVDNYKSLDFNIGLALEQNTANLRGVLESGRRAGLRAVVLTGSVFEQDEGAGTSPSRAFSPYGLSKGLTWQVFRYWSAILDLKLAKFVIPNPFGPFEDPRFCAYLMQRWVKGEVAQVNTPEYVRDNIHVSLLAKSYAEAVSAAGGHSGQTPLLVDPSGYVETQGAFATRFASEIGARLKIATPLLLARQTDFAEPFARINTQRIDHRALQWEESAAWDELAEFYRSVYLSK